jgi:hypothetical protein
VTLPSAGFVAAQNRSAHAVLYFAAGLRIFSGLVAGIERLVCAVFRNLHVLRCRCDGFCLRRLSACASAGYDRTEHLRLYSAFVSVCPAAGAAEGGVMQVLTGGGRGAETAGAFRRGLQTVCCTE